MEDDQPKRSLRDCLYPTQPFTPSCTNMWENYECNNNCSKNPSIEEVLREQANEANVYQWPCSNKIGDMYGLPWDDYHDYSRENGPTDIFCNIPQVPTPDGWRTLAKMCHMHPHLWSGQINHQHLRAHMYPHHQPQRSNLWRMRWPISCNLIRPSPKALRRQSRNLKTR